MPYTFSSFPDGGMVVKYSILPWKAESKLMYVEIVIILMQSAFAIAKNRSADSAVRGFLFKITDIAEIIQVFTDADPRYADLAGELLCRKRFVDLL